METKPVNHVTIEPTLRQKPLIPARRFHSRTMCEDIDDGSELTAAIAALQRAMDLLNDRQNPSPEFLSIPMCEVCGHKPAETILMGWHTPVCHDCYSDTVNDIHRSGRFADAR